MYLAWFYVPVIAEVALGTLWNMQDVVRTGKDNREQNFLYDIVAQSILHYINSALLTPHTINQNQEDPVKFDCNVVESHLRTGS